MKGSDESSGLRIMVKLDCGPGDEYLLTHPDNVGFLPLEERARALEQYVRIDALLRWYVLRCLEMIGGPANEPWEEQSVWFARWVVEHVSEPRAEWTTECCANTVSMCHNCGAWGMTYAFREFFDGDEAKLSAFDAITEHLDDELERIFAAGAELAPQTGNSDA